VPQITSLRFHTNVNHAPLQQTAINSRPELFTRVSAAKAVSFQSTVRVVRTLGLGNFTEEEKQAAYYTSSELETIRSKMKNELASVVAGSTPGDFELRGLEAFFPEASAKKQIRRALAWDEVLEEQNRQWDEQIYNAEYIAGVYRAATEDALIEARCHALTYLLADMNEDDDSISPVPKPSHDRRASSGVSLLSAPNMSSICEQCPSTCPAA
jgi:hypothetical protein